MIDSKWTNQNAWSAGGRSQNLRLAGEGFFGQAVFLSLPPTPPAHFVTRSRSHVQDGAGDRELHVSGVFPQQKQPPTACKQTKQTSGAFQSTRNCKTLFFSLRIKYMLRLNAPVKNKALSIQKVSHPLKKALALK